MDQATPVIQAGSVAPALPLSVTSGIDEYAAGLALALRDYTLDDVTVEKLVRQATALAVLNADNDRPVDAAGLWTALGWRMLLGPKRTQRVDRAVNYLGTALGSLPRTSADPYVRALAASVQVGLAVSYARLPVEELRVIQGDVLRMLRNATRRIPAGPAFGDLRLDLLALWSDVLTHRDLRGAVRRRDASRVRAIAADYLREPGSSPRRYLAAFALGMTMIRLGDARDASEAFRSALRWAHAAGDGIYVGRSLTQTANALRIGTGAGANHECAQIQSAAGRAFRLAGVPREEAEAFRAAGALWMELADWRRGATTFRQMARAAERALADASLASQVRERTITLAHAQQALTLCLARLGRPDEAVVAADLARARRLRAIPRTWDPGFAHVRTLAPLLADEYLTAQRRVRDAEVAEQVDREQLADDVATKLETLAAELAAARVARDEILARMQLVPGARAKFARPGLRRIRAALPARSAAVYIVPSFYGGLALMVRDLTVNAVQLPSLTDRSVSARLMAVARSYDATRDHPNDRALRDHWSQDVEDACRWLWGACMGPILAASGDVDRLILIAAGGLEFLPLHAAWRPNSDGRREWAIDRVAISYAPCVDLQPIVQRSAEFSGQRLVAVAEPAPTSSAPLPGARMEARAISSGFTRSTVLQASDATSGGVLGALGGADVLHAACHGRTEFGRAYASHLLLACDAKLTVSDIVDLRLDRRPSVFLSACETSLTDFAQADEVQSIGAAFLAAGACEVVSTLWAIDDLGGLALALLYYDERLRGRTGIDSLRHAQRSIRDQPTLALAGLVSQMSWIKPRIRRRIVQRLTASTDDYSAVRYWAGHVYAGI